MARILIVEDNPTLLDVLESVLAERHEVRTAGRGDVALVVAREFVPELVVLDLNLPGVSGVLIGGYIKREAEPRRVPILALSALAQFVEEEDLIGSGCCDAFLAKPAPLGAIESKVEELLAGSRA